MRLEVFSVQHFRSITKAEKLPLGDLTVLLGPNNEGKSNILQAMVIGMEELATQRRAGPRSVLRRRQPRTGGGYDWFRDYPQHLQEAKPDGKSTMHFDFRLTDDEVGEFHSRVGSKLNGVLPITLTFGRSGVSTFAVRKQRHSAALGAKRKQIAEFLAGHVEVQYVDAVRTGAGAAEIVSSMLRRELSAAVKADPELEQALEAVKALQEPVFARVAAAIAESIKPLVPEVSEVTIESESATRSPTFTPDLSIIVNDGTPTDLRLKGDGIQSLAALAMTQHYGRETARALEFILAVEEPEAHLHPRAIRALKETLRETAASQQVILTTHSPLLVNRLDLKSNIIVRRNEAKVATSVSELREALGVQAPDNLSSAEVVLLVEGMNDEIALKSILSVRSERLRKALRDGVLGVVALRGGSKLSYHVAQARESLAAVHAFLDNDATGRDAASTVRDEGLLAPADITMASVLGGTESEFEDLVDADVYSNAFLTELGCSPTHQWTYKMAKGKWSSRMRLIFQTNGALWDDDVADQAKSIVAREVAASPESALRDETLPVIETLVEALETKLDGRR